jgi:hypothetical protein
VKAAEAVEQRANKTRKKAHGAKSATLLKKAIEYSDDQPRDEAGRFAEGDSDTVDDETIAHYKSKGAQVSDKGVIRVYHRTTPEAKEKILSSGVMSGKEDGLFFSSKKEGQNAGYGAGVVALDRESRPKGRHTQIPRKRLTSAVNSLFTFLPLRQTCRLTYLQPTN